MPRQPQEVADSEYVVGLPLVGAVAAQVEAIYLASFPAAEREPFATIVQGVQAGSRWLCCARVGGRVVGFALISPLPRARVALLDFLATEAAIRGRGVGRKVVETVAQHLRGDPEMLAMLIEAETDAIGSPEERHLKARRIGFYQRLGAIPVVAVTDYRLPNMAGGDSVAMRLLWLPLTASAAVPRGAELRQLLVTIYADGYGRGIDDPLVQMVLSSIRE